MAGKLIVIYGINNLGKSTQAKRLVEWLNKNGHSAEYLKYPLYDLAPSGPMLNAYLRQNNPYKLSPREAQLLYVMNRLHYQPVLKQKLEQNKIIVAEDYKGTGIAWGIATGVSEAFMKKINEDLINEDLVFLFDGERFKHGIEKNHKHEEDEELMKKVREVHLKLAKEYNWKIINANQPEDKVFEDIKKYVTKFT